ncbi:MAG: acyloxyacyl hydrolase, partial [Desulfobacterales bacterium]
IETTPRFFFNTGIGLALHNGELDTSDSDKKSLGTRLLFRIPFEFGYQLTRHHSLSLMFDHISNAYLANENEGMDTLGLRYGYRF